MLLRYSQIFPDIPTGFLTSERLNRKEAVRRSGTRDKSENKVMRMRHMYSFTLNTPHFHFSTGISMKILKSPLEMLISVVSS